MKWHIRVSVLWLAGFVCCAPALMQVITGTILGVVSDTSGAVIPNASVSLTNSGTNIVTRTRTNTSGEYVATLLPPGKYDVLIEAPGFMAFRQVNVGLSVDSKVRVDASLAVGNVAEVVEVRASDIALQTDSSDLGQTVSAQVIQELPNVGRSPLRFAPLVPGVVPRGGFNAVNTVPVGEDSRKQFSDFSINGGRPHGIEILLDGAPNTSGAFNEIAVLPNADAVGEFKLITNAYSAEFGRAGTGLVQLITRSGTNRYHGSVYEYLRNSAFNANTFGNNANNIRKGVFNLHQFGAAFSGPVRLPGYHGRDRTFFLASFEGIRFARDSSAFMTVPTELERVGNFSQSRALRNGRLVPVNIFNPFPSASTLTATGNGVNREQFQSGGVLNRIPAQYLNPTSLKIARAWPLPNRESPIGDGTQNYFYSGSTRTRTEQIILRADHNFNPSHRLTVRHTWDWSRETPPNPLMDTVPESWPNMPVNQNNPTLAVMYTWTKSATSLFEFRANVTRINLVKRPDAGFNVDLAALGFSPEMVQSAQLGAYPIVNTGYARTLGPAAWDVRMNHTTNPSFVGSYTKILNRLTMKFGGEVRTYVNAFNQPNIASFSFVSRPAFTQRCSGNGCAPIAGDDAQGHGFAAFLVGAMDGNADAANGQYATGDFAIALWSRYAALYTQNDWKVTNRLTVNLGLRWDYGGSLRERWDRLSQFEFDKLNITGTAGRYTFPNFEGHGPGRKDDSYRDFGPRVGFAYRPFDKTVIRAAYGVMYEPVTGTGSGILGFGADGFRALSFLRIRPNTGQYALLDVIDRPYNDAHAGGGKPLGKNPDDPGFLGYNTIAVQRKEGGNPYMQQWNFTIERTLPQDIHMNVSYVGTKGTHMYLQFVEVNGNNALSGSLLEQWRQTYAATGANPANVRVANPFYVAPPGIAKIGSGNPNVAGQTITQGQLYRPYPAFTSVQLGYQRFGSSSYNGLQVHFRRAFKNNIEAGGHYTWSKTIDMGNDNSNRTGNSGASSNVSYMVNDFKLDRSVSQFDTPHRAVIYTAIESPFGKGQPWLSATPVLSQLLGGWRLSTMTQFQSGMALGIASTGGFSRPDLVGDPVLPKEYRCYGPATCKLPDGSTIAVPNGRLLYFNPKAFQSRVIQYGPGAGSLAGRFVEDINWYGTSPRFISDLRGWGVNNTDISVSRSFRLTERASLLLRADITNLFNRTSFADSSIDKAFGTGYLPASAGDAAQMARMGQSTNSTFGMINITGVGLTPRYMQFGARISF